MARRDKREKRDSYGMQEDYRREPERYRQDQGGYDRRYDQGYDPRYGQNYRQDEYGRNGAYRQEYRQDEYGRQGGYRQDYRGGYDNGYYEPDDRRRRAARRKKKKHITFAIEILVLVLLAAGLFAPPKVSKIKRTGVSKGDIVINSDVDLKGYTNIALFGVGSREGSLDKDAHSDSDFIDIARIGGIIVKGTTLHKREGNPYPRMAETPSGMLNAVGLQNKGVDYFVEHIYPRIKDIQTNMIVNVSGSAIEDYVKTAEIINELDKIPAIELNISCPNVKQGGMAFGVSAKGASEVVKAVRSAYKKTLIVKLSPNVTDITEIARAAEESGADSVSLINTLLGMAIDAERKRPILSTITGGMSGAAVKPIALRMVWQVAKAVNIPVIGLGGIMDWKDAVEFMLAGATAIQIGTANFIDPAVTIKVEDGINNYLERHGCKSVKEIIGALEV